MNNQSIYNILKYSAQGLAIYLILRLILALSSNASMNYDTTDILLLTIIIMAVYILFENLCGRSTQKHDSMTESEKNNLCSSVCSINRENMTNLNIEKYIPDVQEPDVQKVISIRDNDKSDIEIIDVINKKPHGKEFNNYLQNLKEYRRRNNIIDDILKCYILIDYSLLL